jgi:hypothetical protein
MNALLDLIRRWLAPRSAPVPVPVRARPGRPQRRTLP